MAPTVYTLDSAEFAVGAKTLGIVHAPGYPLYLVIAHLFTYLPFGDIAYRVNLFSSLSLALTAPVLYSLLLILIEERWVAATSALVFVWSYYGWINGIVAEVYAPQLLTISVMGWLLALLYYQKQRGLLSQRLVIIIGVWYGICVAMAPTSILFSIGLTQAILLLRVPWKTATFAAFSSIAVFLISLAYFPIRTQSAPLFNTAGTYDPAGNFHAFDLTTPAGVWRMVSGRQFASLFFAEGYVPSLGRQMDFLGWFAGNFLGVGAVIGLIGGYILYKRKTALFAVWLCFWLPYTYFFLTYGADDTKMMFSPTYMLWVVVFAYGLKWITEDQKLYFKSTVCLVLVGLFFIVDFPLTNISDDTGVRDEAEAILAYVPQNSALFGQWLDIVPLQYVQQVEKQHTDVTLYNVGLFRPAPDFSYFDAQQRPLFILDRKTIQMYVNLGHYDVIEHHVGGRIIYELQGRTYSE